MTSVTTARRPEELCLLQHKSFWRARLLARLTPGGGRVSQVSSVLPRREGLKFGSGASHIPESW